MVMVSYYRYDSVSLIFFHSFSACMNHLSVFLSNFVTTITTHDLLSHCSAGILALTILFTHLIFLRCILVVYNYIIFAMTVSLRYKEMYLYLSEYLNETSMVCIRSSSLQSYL